VIEQPGLIVARMKLHQDELLRDVVKRSGLVESGGPLRVERFAHEETVEPHLRRIDLLVPEASSRRARVSLQLLAQERRGFAVLLLLRFLVKQQQNAAGKNMIDVVLVDRVCANGTVVGDEVVHAVLNKLEILLVAG